MSRRTSWFSSAWFSCPLQEGDAYGAAVGGVDAVDQVDGKIMLIWRPWNDCVSVLLQRRDDGLDAAEDGWVREDLVIIHRSVMTTARVW